MPTVYSARSPSSHLKDTYLARYAEPEAAFSAEVEEFLQQDERPDRVLIIPACGEKETLPHCLSSAVRASEAAGIHLLVILVLNHRTDTCKDLQLNNLATLAHWKSELQHVRFFQSSQNHSFTGTWNGLRLLIADRCSSGSLFPAKEGVGLARKIGCDIAYSLWKQNLLACDYAHTTDGDALLPADYFQPWHLNSGGMPVAVIYPFEHRVPEASDLCQKNAITAYQNFLLSYRDGLRSAGSPYAFHSIGSTISFSLNAYGHVRGFPRRLAGEDFYFLNKLRKIGAVLEAESGPVILQGRLSTRVPFGTGQAIRKMMDTKNSHLWCGYPPSLFMVLRGFLEAADRFCEHLSKDRFEAEYLDALAAQFPGDPLRKIKTGLSRHPGLEKFISELPARAKTTESRKKHFLIWFDAFKTLRMIHDLRDNYL